MRATKHDATTTPESRRRWEKPTVRQVGAVSDVLKGGGGKLSVAGGDPGDGRKQTGGVDPG
jgi:hypothetical protein